MSGTTLIALLGKRVVGTLRRNANRLAFHYGDGWRADRSSIALSLSMPLAAAEHGHTAINAFLWGLLPDNERVLEQWGRRFQVSPRNPFALIQHVGEDCAGAVQFATPDRVDALTTPNPPAIEWLDDTDVEQRLRALRQDPSRGRNPDDAGQFSLAGAQPKTALLLENGRWGIPSGRTPTTHILKPPTGEFYGHAENEHFCLTLARRLGLPAARSEVRRFGDEHAIVVERYDRVRPAEMAAAAAARAAASAALASAADAVGESLNAARSTASAVRFAVEAASLGNLVGTEPVLRLHQEDFCQALAVMPHIKYQNEGGPTPAGIVNLLRESSSAPAEDIATFADALILNWLLCGTDAHAKNYSLLHAAGGQVRLAPLYDLASALPYDTLDKQRIRLAMAIGGEYRIRDVGARQWRAMAKELRMRDLPDRVTAVCEAVARQAPAVRDGLADNGLDHPIIDRLATALVARAHACRSQLQAAA